LRDSPSKMALQTVANCRYTGIGKYSGEAVICQSF
jgi:hypothetical protein